MNLENQETFKSIDLLTPPAAANSAQRQLSIAQQSILASALGFCLVALLAGVPLLHFFTGGVAFFTLCYAGQMSFNLFVLLRAHRTAAPGNAPPAPRDRASLPTYALLVPLYKETEVLPHLAEHLQALDYPVDKLDILLLLESDDHAMIAAVEHLRLPPHFRAVLVPPFQPRTKPKALNYGLQFVNSDYCVVFDAEDQPEPDQLLKAVDAFSKAERDVICLQAKLAYHNAQQNWLTRFFTSEYATWYRLVIPALSDARLLFLLGGTSNHFRTHALRELGGWDSYNVTEDADLGIRIAKAGYRIASLDSVTWEEANSSAIGWVKQRSRWIKGFMQTYLVHMRAPGQLLQKMGLWRFLTFQLLVGAAPYVNMVNPVFWLLSLVYVVTRAEVIEMLYPAPLFYAATLVWLVGNLVSIYLSLTGSLIHGDYGSVKLMLLTPVYWVLMSIAAWRAFQQLVFKPHYWEKTQHGLAARRR